MWLESLVPWIHAGRDVGVSVSLGTLEVHWSAEVIARHELCSGRHKTVTVAEHHAQIPLGSSGPPKKIRIHLVEHPAPEVEVRPLARYAALAEVES